ncbi:MAG TPA: formyltransferase family protein [Chryseosolibacter sp.]
MKKIVILGSDTPHRRFFIKSLIAKNVPVHAVIFETESIKPAFETGPFFENEEREYEGREYFREFDNTLDEIPVHYYPTINDLRVETLLAEINPHFGIVFGTRKVAQRIIRKFSDCALNVHRGIAEEYRGLDTNLWAIYHGDFENTGVTIHKMDNDLDTGEIVFQEKLQYPPGTKVFQLRHYETALCAELVARAVGNYLTGELTSRPQTKKGRYYSFMPLVIKHSLVGKLERHYNYATR